MLYLPEWEPQFAIAVKIYTRNLLQKKVLLVLTDGEPVDIDVKDPQHLRLDAKKAIEALKTLGIVTFCISLDAYADEYVARIFGKNRYMVINHVDKLPERLPQLFISLSK